MAHGPTPSDASSDAGGIAARGRRSPPSTPRWVKAFGIIVLVFIVLFVILHLAGFGMGGHMPHMQ